MGSGTVVWFVLDEGLRSSNVSIETLLQIEVLHSQFD